MRRILSIASNFFLGQSVDTKLTRICENRTYSGVCGATVSRGKVGVVAEPVVRTVACAGLVAAGLLISGGIASADSGLDGLGGLGIGRDKDGGNKPRGDSGRLPVSPPVVRIGARGGFEVAPGGIRIGREPGFRGGFEISPSGPRLTIDEHGISGAFNLGPKGSRVT